MYFLTLRVFFSYTEGNRDSIILIINLDILFICYVKRINNFHGILLLVFQEQVDNTAADQVSPLERKNIYLRCRVSVLPPILATSEAFVTVGDVCEWFFLLLHTHIPCWDVRDI